MSGLFQEIEPHTPPRLLIIDDDQKLTGVLRDYLEPLGYSIDLAHTGTDGLQLALQGGYDAIILDVMLPGMNGLDVLREIRKRSSVPILMLSALGDEPDRIAGLEVGADDYLSKTFSPRELLARLRAVLRRSFLTAQQQDAMREAPISVGELWIDPSARIAAIGEKPLVLTPVEFQILAALARAVGRVKTREQLLLEAADRDFEVFDRLMSISRRSERNSATMLRVHATSRPCVLPAIVSRNREQHESRHHRIIKKKEIVLSFLARTSSPESACSHKRRGARNISSIFVWAGDCEGGADNRKSTTKHCRPQPFSCAI